MLGGHQGVLVIPQFQAEHPPGAEPPAGRPVEDVCLEKYGFPGFCPVAIRMQVDAFLPQGQGIADPLVLDHIQV